MLIAGLIAFTVYTLSRAKKERKQEEEDPAAQKSSIPKAVGLIAIGSGLLYLGGYLTIENVVLIAQGIGISETVIATNPSARGTDDFCVDGSSSCFRSFLALEVCKL